MLGPSPKQFSLIVHGTAVKTEAQKGCPRSLHTVSMPGLYQSLSRGSRRSECWHRSAAGRTLCKEGKRRENEVGTSNGEGLGLRSEGAFSDYWAAKQSPVLLVLIVTVRGYRIGDGDRSSLR